MKTISLILVMLLLTGCSGDNTPTPPPPPPPPANCGATLSWVIPTEYEDQTPLPIEEIDYYTIYINLGGPENVLMEIRVADKNLISWEVKDQAAGSIQFNMTATAVNGLESIWSNSVVKEFDPRCPENSP